MSEHTIPESKPRYSRDELVRTIQELQDSDDRPDLGDILATLEEILKELRRMNERESQ